MHFLSTHQDLEDVCWCATDDVMPIDLVYFVPDVYQARPVSSAPVEDSSDDDGTGLLVLLDCRTLNIYNNITTLNYLTNLTHV